MNPKKLLSGLICASALGAIAIPAAQADVYVEYSAPTIRYEPLPPHARPGYVWQEGHWSWNGHRYVWVNGHWMPAPQRFAYRDRDRDGVPNYADRDIDGDGVPNRFDRAPYNPNWS